MKRTLSILLVAAACFCTFMSRGEFAQSRQSGASSIDDAALKDADSRAGDWITHGRNYAETRFSPLNKINTSNVKDLGLAWSFETKTTRGLEATPLIVDGVMYTTGTWSVVYALDARTGKPLWKWDPQVPRALGQRACCDVVNRGVALYKGKVYVGVLDGRLDALDAKTGEKVWETQTTDPSQSYTITGAPRVVKGRVLIGNGGAEFGVRGYLSAYDAETGKLAWRTYMVPGNPSKLFESDAMKQAAKTWTGEWWKYGGGGTPWDSMAYDPELDLIYVGTGNGSPWNQHIRSPQGGDNLYLSSILALKADTGQQVWYYQTTPGESWDFTATQHIILADLKINGQKRKVLMQAPKNGFFYVLDRTNGKLISAQAFMPITWAKGVDMNTGRPIEAPGVRYDTAPILMKPGPFGAHNWQPMSYDPENGLVYIPAQDVFFIYSQDKPFQYRPGSWNTGVDFSIFKVALPPMKGKLLAWDPVAQKERWHVDYPSVWNGGTLSTAGNLVFQGTADGRFVAYSADKGEKLWEVEVGTGIIASPVTYECDGVQYVAVMAGWGGAYALAGGNASGPGIVPGTLLTFALNGKGSLPEVAHRRPEIEPVEIATTPQQTQAGAGLYARWCSVCHGVVGASGGATPDLRYSDTGIFKNYSSIVLDGALAGGGMPSFKKWLTKTDVEAIRAYVISIRPSMTSAH